MKIIRMKKCMIVSCILLFLVIFCIWQDNDVVVSNYTYENSKIIGALDGYKILQISDLHNKEFGKDQKRLIDIVDKENPDVVVITGDIIDSNHTDIDVTLGFIDRAVKIAPVYYVTGNHEYRLDSDELNKLMDGMEKDGVILLDNEVAEITRGNESFYLIGLDDNNLSDNTLENIVTELKADKLQVLLAHEPQCMESYSGSNVDLVFAGHAHGGQFRLPYIGGIVAPNQGFFPKYTAGTYIENHTTMIVSRGLGNSIMPIRIFNRPEVVVVKLKSI